MSIRVLCLGDVVGRPGRLALRARLPALIQEHNIQCVIANVENAANGSGITPILYEKIKKSGVHLMSMGDHVYRRKESIHLYQEKTDITRPANLGPTATGVRVAVYKLPDGTPLALFTLLGRQYMKNVDCPFRTADELLTTSIPAQCKLIFVDMHAEATSEKIALGWYLDGRVTAVFGTHTHVQTADERLLPAGTAYISDLGMTGPHDGVLGRRADRVISNLLTNMPCAFDIAQGDVRITGALIDADPISGRALQIQRVSVPVSQEAIAADPPSRDEPEPNGTDPW